jgi:hypothetical protein
VRQLKTKIITKQNHHAASRRATPRHAAPPLDIRARRL